MACERKIIIWLTWLKSYLYLLANETEAQGTSVPRRIVHLAEL